MNKIQNFLIPCQDLFEHIIFGKDYDSIDYAGGKYFQMEFSMHQESHIIPYSKQQECIGWNVLK